jgi:hypothetical protein
LQDEEISDIDVQGTSTASVVEKSTTNEDLAQISEMNKEITNNPSSDGIGGTCDTNDSARISTSLGEMSDLKALVASMEFDLAAEEEINVPDIENDPTPSKEQNIDSTLQEKETTIQQSPSVEDMTEKRNAAAIKIQKVIRGAKERKLYRILSKKSSNT